MEVFKQIVDYPDYFISNRGRVLSRKRGITKFMKLNFNSYGYLKLRLYNSTHDKLTITCHRLVALYFVHNDNPLYTIINHKDGIKVNCHYTNLEWGTTATNNKHAIDMGLNDNNGAKSRKAFFTNEQIINLRKELKTITVPDMARKLEVSVETIRKIYKRQSYRNV